MKLIRKKEAASWTEGRHNLNYNTQKTVIILGRCVQCKNFEVNPVEWTYKKLLGNLLVISDVALSNTLKVVWKFALIEQVSHISIDN